MIKKILIANRGEIALRIIRTCKELGIQTVAVYSTADVHSLHVRFADEAVCIGPPEVSESYLNIPRIIAAAEITDADAIHPGYGFLAENAEFAEICNDSNIIFIGPSPEMITAMGDKLEARINMQKIGVPIVPGTLEPVKDLDTAKKVAEEIGYPIFLKAAGGGGGKGMRAIYSVEQLENQFYSVMHEAKSAFGNDNLYIEKFFEKPRHIEIQIIGDKHGNICHVGERDCSIQRKHQKLIEETPSPFINEEIRQKIAETAIKVAKSINYYSAGTVEFLVDENRNFYFLEMNTRIQVEHPITEAVTGLDFIKEQIKVAEGEKLPKRKFKFEGHSIECRINAEDPEKNFMPSVGFITTFHAPGGYRIRLDSHCYSGYTIPKYYDSLIGKLIVKGETRDEAIRRMLRALDEFIIEGIKTTIPFHMKILRDKRFIENNYDTNLIDNNFNFND
ncbi:MAG: acetyl-CoA carboxylase biotin carboxylase subunit [Ignavibacteria bacterium]|nr:acetyl-CoA carboxylase biotin carboxylase subunit [Ignavibacteria bacterium]